MKKIKILTISLVVTLVVASVSIFYACEKEKITDNLPGPTTNNSMVKDYDAYIEELIASTGIDIYALSQLEEVQKVADKQLRMMNAATATLQTKGELTEEKLIQMQNLGNAINAAYKAGNDYEVLRLYESLCAIFMTIDGFIPDMKVSGVQTFTYDPNKVPIQIPLTYMQTQQVAAVALVGAVQATTPQFTTLAPPVQTQVVAATVFVSAQRTMMAAKGYSTEDCQRQAHQAYNETIGVAYGTFIVALGICAATAAGAPVCAAAAAASFGVAAALAGFQLNRALRRC